MSQSLNPLISIRGLTKKYDKLVVVDNLNLDIQESCFALLGPNGAGKTTIMLMLLGLIKPTNGTALILGKDILKNLEDILIKIGFLPENVGFFPNSTGREHIELILGLRNKTKERREATELLLKWCGLKKEFWDKKVITYSQGMRQRLGIAQAFAGNPKIVFLDEPSHIISEVEQISDSVAIIDNGKIKASDTILALAQSYGLNEYEIINIHDDTKKSLIEIFEILSSKRDLFLEHPQLFSEKIIFRTNNLNGIKKVLKKFDNFEIKPINGTLGKIYIKIIKSKISE